MQRISTKIFDGRTSTEIRDTVHKHYQNHIQGTFIVNRERGITIFFNKRGRVKTAKPLMSKAKGALILNLPVLLSGAKLANVGAAKDKHNALCFLNFQIICLVDGKKRSFRVPVMVTKDGKFQYDLHENLR